MATSDEAGFLEEILAAPADDGPRLIWADWLEERGDQRADFIRAQCAAAKLPAWDVERKLLEHQAAWLWRRHDWLWPSSLPDLPGATWGAFERGMPCEVIIHDIGQFTPAADAVWRTAPEARFRFANVNPGWNEAAGCGWLSRASGLSLPSSLHLQVVTALLQQCDPQRLRRVEINAPDQSIHQYSVFAGRWGETPETVRRLRLDELVLHREPVELPLWMEGLRRLRIVGGDFNHGIQVVANHLPFESLQQLVLFDANLPQQAVEYIATGRALQGLRSLCLTHPRSRHSPGTDVSWLFAAHRLPDLVDLQLDNARVGDEGLIALAQADGLKQLRSLSLKRNSIGVDGVMALAVSPLLGRLELLDLSENSLGEDGARALARSPHLGRLRVLTLQGTDLDSFDLKLLAERLPPGCNLSLFSP